MSIFNIKIGPKNSVQNMDHIWKIKITTHLPRLKIITTFIYLLKTVTGKVCNALNSVFFSPVHDPCIAAFFARPTFLSMLKIFTSDKWKDAYFHDWVEHRLFYLLKFKFLHGYFLTSPTLWTASLNRKGFWSKNIDAQTEIVFDVRAFLRTKELYWGWKICKNSLSIKK